MVRRRWWMLAPVVLALVAVGAAAIVMVRDDSPSTSPIKAHESRVVAAVPVAPLAAPLSRQYLNADGAPLLAMHHVATSIPADASLADCRKTVAHLDRVVTGEDAAALISNVLDDFLRAAFDSERRALGVRLTSCLNGVAPHQQASLAAELEKQSALVEQRLVRLGVS